MSGFKNNPVDLQRLDYRIFQNGWSSLYWRENILDSDIEWFKNERFRIIEFDCTSWTTETNIHKDIMNKLEFPEYYGGNLNALNDCLSDFEFNDAGALIVFRHFQFVERDLAHSLLDIFANNSRRDILFGDKLLTLVQVDNPDYSIEPVGDCPILWNEAEWLDSNRRL